jgi:hypothetical protein
MMSLLLLLENFIEAAHRSVYVAGKNLASQGLELLPGEL